MWCTWCSCRWVFVLSWWWIVTHVKCWFIVQDKEKAKQLLPSVTTVTVPHGPPREIITYEFAPQLLHSFIAKRKSHDIGQPIHWSAKSTYTIHKSNGELGDALSGTCSVYCNAYTRLITNPTRGFFVLIIHWVDRTHITGNGRFTLKPYMFTPAIFTETFRRRIQAWAIMVFYQNPNSPRLKIKWISLATTCATIMLSFMLCCNRV